MDEAVGAWTVLVGGVISQQLSKAPHEAFEHGRFTRLLPQLMSMFLARFGSEGAVMTIQAQPVRAAELRHLLAARRGGRPSMVDGRRPAFRQLLTIGGAVLLCAVLASCSGSSKTSAPTGARSTPVTSTPAETTAAAAGSISAPHAGTRKPCALLTQAEAESAVGQPLTAGVEYAGILCAYRSSDYSGASVDLTVGSWDSINDAAHADSPPPSPINGVGDQALSGMGLSVRKGSAGFVLLVGCPNIGSDQELAEEKTLATLILPRL